MGRHAKDTVDTWWSDGSGAVTAPPRPTPSGSYPQVYERPQTYEHPLVYERPQVYSPPPPPPVARPMRMRMRPAVKVKGQGRQYLATTVLWGLLAFSLYLWWRDTPAGSLQDRGALLVAGGRITGLVAGYLLLVQTLLMSRLRLLERWIGAELLLRWHRDLGAVLLVSVLAHASLITLGYGLLDGLDFVAEVKVLLDEYDEMISATVATGLMVAVGLLAIRGIRTAIPYELWHFLHLASYAVLILSFGHQFAHGQQLFQPGIGRDYWLGLYGAVVAALVWGRVVAPLVLNLRFRFRVAEVVAEGPDIISIYLAGHRLDRLEVRAGQFFRWRFFASGVWTQAHPFSLSAASNGRWLRLTVKVVGTHTSALRGLTRGVRVWAQGPSGSITAQRRTRGKSLLIAGGSGIAPIRALLEELPPGAIVIYRARNAEEVVFEEELERIAENRRAQVWYVLGSRDDPGPRSIMTPQGLRQVVPDVARRDAYLCGPPGLIEAATRTLRQARVPRRQIHVSNFEF